MRGACVSMPGGKPQGMATKRMVTGGMVTKGIAFAIEAGHRLWPSFGVTLCLISCMG